MFQRIVIALGAGVAAAVFFVVPAKGAMLAALFGIAAPLPLMIAGIGFGRTVGGVAAATAAAVVSILMNFVVAAFFLGWVVAPVLCLAEVASWRRSDAGLAVSAAAGLSALLSLGLIVIAVASYGDWNAAVADAATALAPLIDDALGGRTLPAHLTSLDVATVAVRYAPALAAAWTTVALCVNLWIAGRLALASDLLKRPWPNVPDTLRLPKPLGLVFALAVACGFLGGVRGVAADCIAAALGMAFALQGLGAIHAMTRGASARGAILTGAYAMILGLMPWPLALAAGLGLIDCFAALPRKTFT